MNNLRIGEIRATDYVKGKNSPITFKAVLPVGQNWSQHIEFFELQELNGWDTDGCEFFTVQESIDAQMDAFISQDQIPVDMMAQISAMGFMDQGSDGQLHFHSSPRFLQVCSGVGQNGASMTQVWDTVRAFGILPYKDLPFTTPTGYFNPIPQALLDKATQFLTLIGGKNAVQYHWLLDDATRDDVILQQALPQAPICLGVAVDSNGWNQVTPTDPPSIQAPQHAVMEYAQAGDSISFLDHYDPFEKVFDPAYPIHYALQGVISIIEPVEQQIVSETAQVVSEIPSQPISEQPTLIQEVEEVVQKIEAIL